MPGRAVAVLTDGRARGDLSAKASEDANKAIFAMLRESVTNAVDAKAAGREILKAMAAGHHAILLGMILFTQCAFTCLIHFLGAGRFQNNSDAALLSPATAEVDGAHNNLISTCASACMVFENASGKVE